VKQISSHFTTKSHNEKESLSPLRLFCPRILTPNTPERVAAAVAAPEEDIFTQQQRACVMCDVLFFSESKKASVSFFCQRRREKSQKTLETLCN
jgi:hypothetical protein